MPDRPYLHDSSHVGIYGITGAGQGYGGKTATANWWMTQAVKQGHFRYGMAFSPKGGNFNGSQVVGPKEAATAVRQGDRQIEWSPKHTDLDDSHHDFIEFAKGLNGSVICCHDDAVMYAGAESLKWAVSLAGNPGGGNDRIKSLVVSQDPWDLPRKGIRTNLPVTVWVGPVSEQSENYFKSQGLAHSYAEISRNHDEPHVWTVINGNDVETWAPVPEKYA